jgi:hypothetical protein
MGWFYDNYKWLFDGVAGAAAIALTAFLAQRFLSKESSKNTDIAAQGAKLEASPVASGDGISQIVNSPTINMFASPSPAPQLEEQAAVLSFVQCRTTLLHQDQMGVWYEASTDLEHACRGLIVQFRNRPSTLGQRVPKASSVIAALVFRSPDMPDELDINHAVWLGRYEHMATFGSGQTHQLLLAVKLLPYVTFDNPNRSNPFRGRWRSGMSIHKPQAYTLAEGDGQVEITLIDAWNTTVFTGLFYYHLADGEMSLKQR